jgi:hypothetical protein
MADTFRRLVRAYQAAALAQRAGEALNWRLLRRLLSAAREMVRDRAKVMADLDKTERDLDKSLRRSSKPKISRQDPG